ncbi:hypothetical protein IWX49DRAFT_313855 [Phyllosticta citricarpa]|uniref:F-box domain-containing protein n=2 Tax=Phyllosticta TaxID=121621 RepID=A0ABR1LE03_9PEZI
MDSLPNELRLQILSYLDSEPPSATRFFDEPSPPFLTVSCRCDLKRLSLVSRSWRRIVIPSLFRHVRLFLGQMRAPVLVPTTNNVYDVQDVRSQVLVSTNPYWFRDLEPQVLDKGLATSSDSWRMPVPATLYQMSGLGLQVPVSSTNRYWLRDLEPQVAKFLDFLKRNAMKRHVKSLVLCTNFELAPGSAHDRKINQDQSIDFWDAIFSCIEPQAVKLAAPPTSLATLTGSPGKCFVDESRAYDMHCHLVELRQHPQHFGVQRRQRCSRENRHLHPAATLMTKRRWSHIGYNEGISSAKYPYPYRHKGCPSILGDLLKEDMDSYVPQSLAYISIYPSTENLEPVLKWLINELNWRNQSSNASLEPLDKNFEFQFAPDPDSRSSHTSRARNDTHWGELKLTYNMLGIAFAWPRLRSLKAVTCRDYRCRFLVDELDHGERLGILRDRGWTKVGSNKWVDYRDHRTDDPGLDIDNLSLT